MAHWNNITEEFREACQELEVGELVSEPGFGLFEAMSAFEMMDPKMDAGMLLMSSKKPIKTFSSAMDSGEIRMTGFSDDEMLAIMDGTLCCLASWLDGNSLVQTVYTNLYLHNPSLLEDPVLKAFCLATLKLVDKIRELVTLVNVYEEEHFQPMTYGFGLAEELSCARTCAMLKEADDEISKVIRNLNRLSSSEGGDHILLKKSGKQCLQHRVRFLRSLLTSVLVMKYEPGIPFGFEAAVKNLSNLTESINFMLDNNAPTLVNNPLSVQGFDLSCTSRLLAPSFPRTIKIMGFTEALAYYKNIVDDLTTVINMPISLGMMEVVDFFDKFNESTPSVLIRSILLFNYLPQPSQSKIRGKVPVTDALVEELKSFNNPPTVSTIYKPVLLNHEDIKAIYSGFLSNAAHVMESLYSAKCQNRARQREKLSILLDDCGVLQGEADRVDSIIDTVLREKIGEKAVSQLAAGIGTWILFLTTKTMISYLLLGMELELYDVREYGYVFWYLYDVLYAWYASALSRAETCLTEMHYHEQKNNKKKHKPKKLGKSLNPHQKVIFKARTFQQLSGGVYYLTLALKQTEMLPTTGDYRYDNEEVRYEHRFAPFRAVITPAVVSYQQFIEVTRYNQIVPVEQVMEYMAQAYRAFQQSKVMLENDHFKDDTDLTRLVAVAKNNVVVTKLLADDIQNKRKRAVRFDFSTHKIFPMVKLC